MMNIFKRRRTGAQAVKLCVLAFLAMLCQAQSASAQWTTSGDHITNTNPGNVGVGTATPSAKLDIIGTVKAEAFSVGGASGEKTFSLLWSNDVANQKVQVYWPANTQVDGIFEITVTGHYWYSNSNGGIRKRIVINGRNIGVINMQQSEVPFRLGFTGSSDTISNIMWDAANSRYYFIVSNLDNKQNGITIHVKSITPGATAANAEAMSMTPIYTTDTTAYPQLYTSFMSGNIGVGTNTPGYRLDVQGGAVNASGGLCIAGDCKTSWSQVSSAASQWTTAGSNIHFNTGNVGIGTSTPSQMFQVHSGSTWAGMRTTTAATGATVNDGANFGFDDAVGAMIWNREASPIVFATSNAERLRVDALGNVGIGTTTPGMKLHVADMIYSQRAGEVGFQMYNGGSVAEWAIRQRSAADHNLYFSKGVNGIKTDYMMIGTTGLVGIGTSAPGYRLDVQNGAVNASGGLCIAGVCKTDWAQVGASQWTTAGANVHYGAGNVGIGNASPGSKLFVGSGTPSVTTLPGINVALGGNTYVATSNGVVNTFIGSDISPYGIVGTLSNHPLGLRANNVLAVTVQPSGNVGIGTAAPETKLHVMGDLKVSGNISAKYQDVAEWVPSLETLSAGMVVILDPEHVNHVQSSNTSYDTSVAGVVSAQPGLSLGEPGEGKALIATTGRVRVKVDASRAPIRIGDLLVTSDLPGVAMKSEAVAVGGRKMHSPGTIIGKALEPLAKGTGEILVLLSLQ
ncbi:MAG TPA: hypothetical protein VGB76_06125 [Pyrinomonadaceae bacterium]|jgi:hypothetical protein